MAYAETQRPRRAGLEFRVSEGRGAAGGKREVSGVQSEQRIAARVLRMQV